MRENSFYLQTNFWSRYKYIWHHKPTVQGPYQRYRRYLTSNIFLMFSYVISDSDTQYRVSLFIQYGKYRITLDIQSNQIKGQSQDFVRISFYASASIFRRFLCITLKFRDLLYLKWKNKRFLWARIFQIPTKNVGSAT